MKDPQFWINASPWILYVLTAIAAITPTPKDNKALKVIRVLLDAVAFNFGYAKNAPVEGTGGRISGANPSKSMPPGWEPPAPGDPGSPGKKGHHQTAKTRGGRHRG